MAKEYIGSQEHFEDEINAYYDQKEEMEKQYEKEMLAQMEKNKYEKLATLAADGTRTDCNSFAIRRRLKELVSSEEYYSVLQKRKEVRKSGEVLPKELSDKDDGNIYDWVVVGEGKYDRIMYCLKTKQFRYETMGEFFENAVVD